MTVLTARPPPKGFPLRWMGSERSRKRVEARSWAFDNTPLLPTGRERDSIKHGRHETTTRPVADDGYKGCSSIYFFHQQSATELHPKKTTVRVEGNRSTTKFGPLIWFWYKSTDTRRKILGDESNHLSEIFVPKINFSVSYFITVQFGCRGSFQSVSSREGN